MPAFTTAPPFTCLAKPDTEDKIKMLFDWSVRLSDELTYMFNNLDAGNVMEAHMVRAHHIDATQAKIKNAQIHSLTADKITAGMIDTKIVTISNNSKQMVMEDNYIKFYDKDEAGNNQLRMEMGDVNGDGGYAFNIYYYAEDENGVVQQYKTICLEDTGNAKFMGKVEASVIYSSVFYGAMPDEKANHVEIYEQFIKMVGFGDDGSPVDKLTFAFDSYGVPWLLIGAGEGEGTPYDGMTLRGNQGYLTKGKDEFKIGYKGNDGNVNEIAFARDGKASTIIGNYNCTDATFDNLKDSDGNRYATMADLDAMEKRLMDAISSMGSKD